METAVGAGVRRSPLTAGGVALVMVFAFRHVHRPRWLKVLISPASPSYISELPGVLDYISRGVPST